MTSPAQPTASKRPRIKLEPSHLKMALRLGLTAVIIAFTLGAVGVLSRAMADISRSEETAAIFNVSAKLHHDLLGAVDWRPDGDDVIKQMTPLAREDLSETWLRAWTQFLILSDGMDPVGSAAAGTNTTGLGEYFDASALDAMGSDPDAWLARPLHQISHDLELTFYHNDASVAAVTSHGSRFLRGYPVDGEIAWYDTTETYEAIFVFERGNWRVHHWVRTGSQGRWAAEQILADRLPLAVDDYRAMTYRANGQTVAEFWEDPDEDSIAADLAQVAELGFNIVRLEIPFEQLGGRGVTAESLAAARTVLDAAHAEGLGATLALLNGRSEHQPLHWDADDDHITIVAETLGDHPALELWELATAPDLDIGVERVELNLIHAWLTHISLTLRAADPNTPMAIDWSTGTAAAVAPPIADVVSFGSGGDPLSVEPALDRLRDVGDDRPVLVSDAGFHTSVGILAGSQTEADQARYYSALLTAVRDAGVAGFGVATLADFDIETVGARAQAEAERRDAEEKAETARYYEENPVPKTPEPKELGPEVHEAPVLAEVTWPVGADANLGLLRVDGSAKPAAALFAPGADLSAVPALTMAEKVLKPFNIVLLFLVGAGGGGWLLLAIWDRNLIRRPRPLRFGFRLATRVQTMSVRLATAAVRIVARPMRGVIAYIRDKGAPMRRR